MKKIIISLIIAALIFTLIYGCASNQAENNTTSQRATDNSSTASTTETDNSTTKNGTTNVAQTDVQPDAVGSKNYNTEKVIWGPGRAENHSQPTDPVMLNGQYKSLDGHFLLSDKSKICLTFDEGYENGYTPSILDTLKKKNVKAIFFVTYDFARDNPDLIKRMIKEGHIIGNHTYRHYTMDEVDRDTATEEIMYLDAFMRDKFNYKMTLFRFPKGEFSEDALALAKELGYKSVFWSFAYADWDTQNPPDKTQALEEITKYTHPGEIMLLHAVSSTNAEILSDIIDNARNQGYSFTVKVS